MNRLWAMFKKELRTYFTSPIAYAVMVIFLAIVGFLFAGNVLTYSMMSLEAARNPYLEGINAADLVLVPLFGNMGFVLLFLAPALTMRLFAEEKRSGTFELLCSYPLRDLDVVLGKFLAAFSVTLLMILLTGINGLILWGLGRLDLGVLLAGYLGIVLLAASFLALGIFVSTLTENQIVAAVVSLGALLLLWLIGWSATKVGPAVGQVLEYLSLVQHLIHFARGGIDTADVAYFLMFTFFFLFLTLRSLESKRWRG